MQFQKVHKKNEKVTKPSNTIKITTRKYIIQTMTKNSNKKNKSKTNLSTKSIVSSKFKNLKELRNPNDQLFLCPLQK